MSQIIQGASKSMFRLIYRLSGYKKGLEYRLPLAQDIEPFKVSPDVDSFEPEGTEFISGNDEHHAFYYAI